MGPERVPPGLSLLCCCLSPRKDAPLLEIPPGAWEESALIANRSLLAPAFRAGLREKGLCKKAPAQLLELLDALHAFNKSRNEALLAQLNGVTAALNEAGVTPMLFKGSAALAEGLYGDPAARFMWDLDLLVPEEDLDRSVKALEKRGYRTVEGAGFDPVRHHYPKLFNPSGEAGIELHRSPVPRLYTELLPAEELWRLAEPVQGAVLGSAAALAMHPGHQLLHCFVHSELSHENHWYRRLDLRQMQHFLLIRERREKDIDWEAVERTLNSEKYGPVLNAYLYAAKTLFGVEFPLKVEHSRRAGKHLERAIAGLTENPESMASKAEVLFLRLKKAFTEESLRRKYPEGNSSLPALRVLEVARLLKKYTIGRGKPD